jgi:hypothetical protein
MEMPWGPIPDDPAPQSVRRGMAADLLSNFRAGLRLSAFRPVEREDFCLGRAQAGAFIPLGAVLVIAFHVMLNMETWRFEAEQYGILAGVLVALWLLSRIYARQYRDERGGSGVIIIAVSSILAPALALAAAAYASELIADVVSFEDSWLYYMPLRSASVGLALWFAATLIRTFCIVYSVSVPRAILLALVPIVGLEILASAPSVAAFARIAETKAEIPKWPDLDVERTFYAQPGLVDRAAAELAPERPGTTDLYFLGFAGYASQNVFRSEVERVTAQFDERFDTQDRSLMLINNVETMERTPIASTSNLERALRLMAAHMNRDEDILFLFLTSHGSPGVFSVEFAPMQLNNLPAEELDRMLDASGIKWRVVVVSACYSGSFIAPLKDDNTLIITAASADRTSFGCSNENEYTYFGEAYFKEALQTQMSFVSAFHQAAEAIARRENAEGLTPSQPQIHVGSAIQAKLTNLERRLAAINAAAGVSK